MKWSKIENPGQLYLELIGVEPVVLTINKSDLKTKARIAGNEFAITSEGHFGNTISMFDNEQRLVAISFPDKGVFGKGVLKTENKIIRWHWENNPYASL